MERETISTENVPPSSPTPQSQQRYNLSMLDQMIPSMLVPLVLYYPYPTDTASPDDPHSFAARFTSRLRRSLSVILTRFYPLAGRVNPDGQSIDCHDQGVPFTVVRFPATRLSDLLSKPDEALPRHLLPCPVTWDSEPGPGSSPALVQLSHFSCGGAALSLVLWHKAADAATLGEFVAAWAATARPAESNPVRPISPNYLAQHVFPFRPEIPSGSVSMSEILKTGTSVMRRFVFDKVSVEVLKSSISADTKNLTRVEAVSALLWRCFMAASLANGRAYSVLTHAVNLRRRARPPFGPDCFGNFPGLAAASAENREEFGLVKLVEKMRGAVGKIDGEFVERMMGDEGLEGYRENLGLVWRDIPRNADMLSISSWCGFGFYEAADFGFGRPDWVTRCEAGGGPGSKFLNVVWLMDTRDGKGVEAWVVLDEKYMTVFEGDVDLRARAWRDPSPVDNAGGFMQ